MQREDVHTPVTVVTGFLGSGKTTLLNRALRDPAMAHTLIVINEFGDISIDHALTAASNDAIVVLENGCLCCTVFGDLVQTFQHLYTAREAGEIAFDHVVVETSGLAEVAPVTQAFLSQPTLEGLYRVVSVIATVDAVNGPGTLDEHAVSVGQVALADHLLITKLDLIAEADRPAARAALTARLRTLNRTASIDAVDDAGVDPIRMMREASPNPSQGPQAAKAWLETALAGAAPAPAPAPDHHEHAHGAADGPAPHHHDAAIASFNLIREAPLPREAVTLLLLSLERHLGPKLLRVKGLINVAEEPGQPAVVQGAQHLLHNLTWLAQWPDEDRRTRIVFITQGVATEELAEMVTLLDRVAQRTAAARARAAATGAGASGEASPSEASPG
ncbi:MAG: CobW family GTP-binding protein [Steroidobacteraceae bacterium]